MEKAKVRFAPSPTGPLHIGGARSALFNYLFAEHYDAEMILRIEDTDLERSSREYEDEIIESLRWLGLQWSEGVDIGGVNAPYRQTERLDKYADMVEKLIQTGQAYYCFCSGEELEAQRQDSRESGAMPKYSGKCRSLTDAEREELRRQGLQPTVRFKVPPHTVYAIDDLVRGRVAFESDNIGDFIIIKSDGIPTYNFAVVIDDFAMGITHIIRAEEHLSNTPRQLMIYDALEFKRPAFAHISLILGSDRQKMSKRHGATSVVQYRDMGYLPEAVFNYLALLGWSPDQEEEILSRAEIISAFTLERVAKNPAVFDLDKLNWINQQYLKKLSDEEFEALIKPYLDMTEYAEKISGLSVTQYLILIKAVRDRITKFTDVNGQLAAIFAEPDYDQEALEVLQWEEAQPVLNAVRADLPEFLATSEAEQFLKAMVKSLKLKPKFVYMPLRAALSGKVHGPDLPYLLMIWGREEALRRISQTLENMQH